MKALVIDGERSSRLIEVPSPPLGPSDVRVKIRHVGLCGSDLNTFRGLNPLVNLPRIPGHEIGGEVIARGPDVSRDIPLGARVVVVPYTNCGSCTSCRQGRLNACRYNKTLGVQQDGGLADEIVVPEGKVIVNATLPARRLALVEPLSVGFHAVDRGQVSSADRVVVIGCGMIGMGAIVGAVARGARVLAVEISREKRETALLFGADRVADPIQEDVAQVVEEWTSGDMADVVIEAVGLPQTFTQSIDLACFAGRVVYIGYSKAPVTYDTKYFNLKELDIRGSRNATIEDFRAVISCLEILQDKVDALISKVFPFAQADQALPFWDADPNALKVIVET